MTIWRPDIFYNYIGIWRHLESFSIYSTDLSQDFVEVINFLWNPGGNVLRPISNQYKLRPKDPRACMLFVWFQLFGDITAWCWYISYTPLIHGSFEAFFFPWVCTQSCPTLCNPMNFSLPGSSVYGISCQEYWNGLPCPPPSWPRDQIWVSCIEGRFFTVWATSIKICICPGGAY